MKYQSQSVQNMEHELFSTRNKNVHGHKCGLVAEEAIIVRYIDSGFFVNTRRAFKKLFMVSPKSPETKAVLKSTCEIRLEEEKHLRYHYNMIHPFSTFRMYWETIMIPVYITLLTLIPMELCAGTVPTLYYVSIKFIFDFISIVDIVLFFFTGYIQKETQKITLAKNKVVRRYVTHYFLVDFLSTVPISMLMFIFDYNLKFTGRYGSVKLILVLKLARIPTLLGYLRKFFEMMHIMTLYLTMLKFILMFFLFLLWTTSLFYGIIPDSDYFHDVSHTLNGRFITEAQEVILQWLLITPGGKDDVVSEFDIILQPICLIIGSILYMILLAQMMQIYNRHASSKNKYNNLVQQIGEYMEYKELPVQLQEKVFRYVDFKFQKNIYKEADILNTLSSILREDILLHNCKKLVEKVDYFKDLPTALISRIAIKLKSEIYLPNDVIVQAGITGNAMYFILIGTIAVYTRNGKEICHLNDGAHFGEIALVINEPRVATCVAIKECELFRLSRKDFHEAIQPFPELSNKIKTSALARLETTRKIMEQVPDEEE